MTEDDLRDAIIRHLRAMYVVQGVPISTGILTRQLLRVYPRERFTAHKVGRLLTTMHQEGLVVLVPDVNGARRWRARKEATA